MRQLAYFATNIIRFKLVRLEQSRNKFRLGDRQVEISARKIHLLKNLLNNLLYIGSVGIGKAFALHTLFLEFI